MILIYNDIIPPGLTLKGLNIKITQLSRRKPPSNIKWGNISILLIFHIIATIVINLINTNIIIPVINPSKNIILK